MYIYPTPPTAPISSFNVEVGSTGKRTGLWWGPLSPNEVIQAFFIDGENPQVEYYIEGYPDMNEEDARDFAQEILAYVAKYNTATVFNTATKAAA